MTLQAGDLRKRIKIQQEVNTPNQNGGAASVWQDIPGCSSVPAKIVYPPPSKKGDEVYTQQQIRSSVFTTITIRYRPSTNISAANRVMYGTRIFNIRTILPVDEYLQEVTMQCEEQQGKGTLHT